MLKLGENMIDYEDNLEEAQTRPRPNRPAEKIDSGEGVPWGAVNILLNIY